MLVCSFPDGFGRRRGATIVPTCTGPRFSLSNRSCLQVQTAYFPSWAPFNGEGSRQSRCIRNSASAMVLYATGIGLCDGGRPLQEDRTRVESNNCRRKSLSFKSSAGSRPIIMSAKRLTRCRQKPRLSAWHLSHHNAHHGFWRLFIPSLEVEAD